MHNNYHYLRQISVALRQKLTGWQVGAAFSQDKDELVLGFVFGQDAFFIRAVVQGGFVCLTFPTDFRRARKNSVDLFAPIIGKTVTDVIQYRDDRSLGLLLDADAQLLFRLHGNRANIILLQDGKPVELLHSKIGADWQLRPETLHRHLQPGFEDFVAARQNPAAVYPTLGKLPLAWLNEAGFQQKNAPEQWEMLQSLLRQLEQPAKYYVSRWQNLPVLSLLPLGDIRSETADPLEAANQFYALHARESGLGREKNAVLKELEKRRKNTENYLAKTYGKLNTLQTETRNEQLANILMANLHQIPAGSESVELLDFYHDQPIRIKLKRDLSPQKNAETYYRKGKNEKIETAILEKSIGQKETELHETERHLHQINAFQELKPLRIYLKDNGLAATEAAPETKSLFRRYEHLGFEILVGRNAKNNDLLTQQYAWKEDLWLHAKDVTGSHVVIKHQAGKPFPEPVIERAAQLAAFFSKRKNDTLCPVTVTPRKYVRKAKGLPDGAVIVAQEKVILVEPVNFDVAGKP